MSGTILDTIVARVRERLSEMRTRYGINDFESMPLFDRIPLELAPALRRNELSIVAEIKRASPSRGVIRNEFEPADLARAYASAAADAVSVLTEPDFFQGEPGHLALAREAVSLPLLRKDFIVDPLQLFEARAFGADAVLLIVAVLDASLMDELVSAAGELGLSCLVEVHESRELDRLDFDRIELVGVNNRDLRTFEVDTGHAARVLSHVPSHIVRVAESGMKSARDLLEAREAGIDAVLIGETFMRADNPGAALRRLRQEFGALSGAAASENGPEAGSTNDES